jgi:hypothetical protein
VDLRETSAENAMINAVEVPRRQVQGGELTAEPQSTQRKGGEFDSFLEQQPHKNRTLEQNQCSID